MRRCAFLLLGVLTLAAPAAAAGYSDWAAIVVAGDSYSEDRKDTQVFDNGRITIAKALVGIGFRPTNIRQFTDWPQRYHDAGLGQSTPKRIGKGLGEAASRATAGCLIYLTSHGSQAGISVGDYVLGPRNLKRMVAKSCRGRPAVIVVSACYSGVFVPYLKAPDRIVLTAAAKDRSSFGCGATDKYTYFDACAVEALSKTGDFAGFGKKAIACVAAREKKEQVDLPSNPQLAVGAQAAAVIPRWK